MTQKENPKWPEQIFDELIGAGVSLLSYVPDAGNARLVELAEAHNDMRPILLTTEEEGVAICAGADLVGKRAAVCMQSSGVGNCPNFLSFVKGANFPFLMIVTMRGEYGEQNPWQYPMGQAVEPILHAMGVLTFRVDTPDDLLPATQAAISTAFKAGQTAALILSQRFLGAKPF